MILEVKNKVQIGDVILRSVSVEIVYVGIRLDEIIQGEKKKEEKGINCKYYIMIGV